MLDLNSVLLATDSYKLTHFKQYPENTQGVYSYLEARNGARYTDTVFFGLQPIIDRLAGVQFTQHDLNEAATVVGAHLGRGTFNYAGWEHILDRHQGRLPVRIRAVPEGTVVPSGNVLMTVENTDPACYWLTNALESLLLHVWYPTTVASRSRAVKKMLKSKLENCGGSLDGLDFMLHDFGYRGATTHEAAAIGGAGHLVSFKGTDTVPAMLLALSAYSADLSTLGFSVPATEHSVMTALGSKEGEHQQVDRLLGLYPDGILSVVADSYDIYGFVDAVCTTWKDRILARDGVFVVRPDSVTLAHPQPGDLVVDILNTLWAAYGGTETRKGFRVLDPHVRVLWGDGIDESGIEKIINRALLSGYSPENLVFGMGGGLLQKLNRDTQRFAFKSSAQRRDGVWHDVFKRPLDSSKASKRGRLRLERDTLGRLETVAEDAPVHDHVAESDVLRTVFEDGFVTSRTTFDEIRARAAV